MSLSVAEARDRAKAVMPEMVEALKGLISHPSCAFPGFPAEPVHDMRAAVIELFRDSGVDVTELDLGGGYPAVHGRLPGPEGAPRVLCYAHYDVQPAPPEQWATDPFVPTVKDDGRLYGRGAADDKAGIIIHAGALRVLGRTAPVDLTVVIEGEEETASHLPGYVRQNPAPFRADAFLVADMGNLVAGSPDVTLSLRGNATSIVTVRSLRTPGHSGLFGGAAPDALMALIRMLASLQDDNGTAAVAGAHRFDWEGVDIDEGMFAKAAGLVDGARLVGEGSIASRLWSSPAVSVLGIDAPTVREGANVVQAEARAKVSMRLAPGADAEAEERKLWDHLRAHAPWGVEVEIERVKLGHPFAGRVDGPAAEAFRRAMSDAYDGLPCGVIGSGGSIPLVASLHAEYPDAEVILFGAEDLAGARIHAPDESVDLEEIERLIVAEALLLDRLGNLV